MSYHHLICLVTLIYIFTAIFGMDNNEWLQKATTNPMFSNEDVRTVIDQLMNKTAKAQLYEEKYAKLKVDYEREVADNKRLRNALAMSKGVIKY